MDGVPTKPLPMQMLVCASTTVLIVVQIQFGIKLGNFSVSHRPLLLRQAPAEVVPRRVQVTRAMNGTNTTETLALTKSKTMAATVPVANALAIRQDLLQDRPPDRPPDQAVVQRRALVTHVMNGTSMMEVLAPRVSRIMVVIAVVANVLGMIVRSCCEFPEPTFWRELAAFSF